MRSRDGQRSHAHVGYFLAEIKRLHRLAACDISRRVAALEATVVRLAAGQAPVGSSAIDPASPAVPTSAPARPVSPAPSPVPGAPLPAGPFRQRPAFAGPVPGDHIPFTPRAKKTLQLSLREAEALHDTCIGVQHLALALLAPKDGTVPVIVSALGVPATSLRAAILTRYRKAS